MTTMDPMEYSTEITSTEAEEAEDSTQGGNDTLVIIQYLEPRISYFVEVLGFKNSTDSDESYVSESTEMDSKESNTNTEDEMFNKPFLF